MFINIRTLPLGKQIHIKRIVQDIEQRELAKAFNMNVAILSRVENGKQELPKKYVEIVADFIKN